MFNVDGKEFIFLVLIALVVLGPEKLPDLFRRAGKAYSQFQRMSEGFQEEFRRAVEEPIEEVKSTGVLIRESVDLRVDPNAADNPTQESADGDLTRNESTGDDSTGNDSTGNDAAGNDAAGAEAIDPLVHDVELPSFRGNGDAAPPASIEASRTVEIVALDEVASVRRAGADETPDDPSDATDDDHSDAAADNGTDTATNTDDKPSSTAPDSSSDDVEIDAESDDNSMVGHRQPIADRSDR